MKDFKLFRTKLLVAILGIITSFLIAKGYITPEQVDPTTQLLTSAAVLIASVFGYQWSQGKVDVEKEKKK